MNCKRQSQGFMRENSLAATAALAMAIGFALTFILVISVQSAQAQTYQVIYNSTGGQDGAYPEAGLTERGGNLYGTAYQGGSFNRGTVFKLARNGSGWIFSPLAQRNRTDVAPQRHARPDALPGQGFARNQYPPLQSHAAPAELPSLDQSRRSRKRSLSVGFSARRAGGL